MEEEHKNQPFFLINEISSDSDNDGSNFEE